MRRRCARTSATVLARRSLKVKRNVSVSKRSFYVSQMHLSESNEYPSLKRTTTEEQKKAKAISKLFIPHDKAARLGLSLFLECAQYEKALDNVSKDFLELSTLMTQDADWSLVLRDPITPNSIRREGIDTYVEDTPDLHPISKRFLDLLKDSRSVPLVPSLFDSFRTLLDSFAEKVPVTLVFHEEVPKGAVARLIKHVNAELPEGSKPEFSIKTDPSLLSGFRVLLGDQIFIDTSKLGKLDKAAESYLSKLNKSISFLESQMNDRKNWEIERSSLDSENLKWFLRSQQFFAQLVSPSDDPSEMTSFGGTVDDVDYSSSPALERLAKLYNIELSK